MPVSAVPAEYGIILLATGDASGLDDEIMPAFTYDPNMPSDDAGGHIDIYEPAIYVPEGFVADDLYELEFILDQSTGVLTINLYFSTDPLDHQGSLSGFSDPELIGMNGFLTEPILGDLSPEQNGPANGSRCTVTITKTTTTTSPSSSFTFLGGLVNYTSNSGGSSTTTTKTYTVEGVLVNGRCLAKSGR
jgi:hypothetical protein